MVGKFLCMSALLCICFGTTVSHSNSVITKPETVRSPVGLRTVLRKGNSLLPKFENFDGTEKYKSNGRMNAENFQNGFIRLRSILKPLQASKVDCVVNISVSLVHYS